MPLPPKELYTIAEVAERWGVAVRTIEDYLFTDRLQSFVYLPRMTICHYTQQLNYDANLYFEDEPTYVYDIDINDPRCIRDRQGLFNLIYKDIEWNEQGKASLEKDGMYLTLPDEEGYFGFDEPYILDRDDVVITLSEINRFESEHGITPHVEQTNPTGKTGRTTPDPGSKLHPKERESLLKMIIVLAFEAYRYNPADKKSTVPGEIATSAQQLGISIDVDTVRKWLKEAAGLLPRETPTE